MGCDAPLLDISEDTIVRFETVVYPVPQYDPEHPKMISQGPSVCLFQKDDPQEVLASWLFAQFLLTNDVQIAYAETEGYVPVTEKARLDPTYVDYLNGGSRWLPFHRWRPARQNLCSASGGRPCRSPRSAARRPAGRRRSMCP
mgnify:CR=1 FL=1